MSRTKVVDELYQYQGMAHCRIRIYTAAGRWLATGVRIIPPAVLPNRN